MSQGPTIHSGRVLRQMDHLIMALKVDVAAERPDVLLSLYWIGYTVEMGDAASGHVAYLWWTAPTGPREREAALTDNPGLAEALGSRLRPAQWPMRDPGQAALPATFERQVARPYGIAYRVRADGLQVDARWDDLGPPVFASGPTRTGDAWIATMLVESFRPSATINGARQTGTSFPNGIWRPWFGGDRGSCILGLGETIYDANADVSGAVASGERV